MVLLSVLVADRAAAQALSVNAELSPRAIRIGERLTLSIEIAGARPFASAAPALGSTIGPFEVIDVTAGPITNTESGSSAGWVVVLTTFEHGELTVPPISIE